MKVTATGPAVPRRAMGRHPAGFTLLELLVAASITVILAGLVLAAVSAALAHWNRTAGRLGAAAQARVALDQLTQDLQGILPGSEEDVGLAVTVLPDTKLSGRWQAAAVSSHAKPANTHRRTLDLAAARLEDARFGVAGVWLRFFTTKPDTAASGADLSAPVAVGYQIVRQNPTSNAGAEPRYLFFRSEVRRTRSGGGSSGTFEAGYNLDPRASPATPYMAGNATAGDPGNLIRPPLSSALADNVIDFGVRLYVREGASLRLVFPARPASLGAEPAGGELSTAAPPSPETEHLACGVAPTPEDYYRHAFPEVAEIMVRVLTEEGARVIGAYEAGRLEPPSGVSAADYWWALAEQHSEVFTRRITLLARPH